MTLILVRHGESAGNVGGVIQGWSDAALTPAGLEQAEAVADRLASHPLVAVYASPLARARDTARYVASRHGLVVVELPELRERHYGQAQGLTWTQAADRWPLDQATHERDWVAAIPGVESLASLRARSVAVVSELLDRHAEDVAVCVSHGGTLVQVMAHVLGLPEGVWPRIRMSNTSVTVVEGTASAPTVSMLNDICHLPDQDRARTLAL